MPQRNDTILQDIISERFGGSAYYNVQLTLWDYPTDAETALSNSIYEVAWIAPRLVRIINGRQVSTVVMSAGANPFEVFRNIGAGTNRSVITAFEGDALVADTVATSTLSTATTDNLANVVCPQYGFYVLIADIADATTGPFNVTWLGHYSFED